MTVWVGRWFPSVLLPILNPLVDGAWKTVLCAIYDLLLTGHKPGGNVKKWIEIVFTEALVHLREEYFGRWRDAKRSTQIKNRKAYLCLSQKCPEILTIIFVPSSTGKGRVKYADLTQE